MTLRIDDGFSTTILFADYPTVQFWEKTVKPPGIAGGGEVDTTTMRNTAWRTRNPKKLKTLTPAQTTVAYDPAAYEDIVSMCNINQLITVTFPDGDTLAFWGWLDDFDANELVEGDQPTAGVTIIPSNQNASGTETAPVRTAVTTTTTTT